MAYKFYIQKEGDQERDIESAFKCKYVKFSGLVEKGEVKNAYFEEYAEQDGSRAYIPSEPKHKSTECSLTLLFNESTCLADSMEFESYVSGSPVEYHDDFRGRYAWLVMIKPPTVGKERLYGEMRFREITYTFKNMLGDTYDTPRFQQAEE